MDSVKVIIAQLPIWLKHLNIRIKKRISLQPAMVNAAIYILNKTAKSIWSLVTEKPKNQTPANHRVGHSAMPMFRKNVDTKWGRKLKKVFYWAITVMSDNKST